MQVTAAMQPDVNPDAETNSSTPEDPVDSPELSDVNALFGQAMATFASMAEDWKKALNDLLVEGRDTAASARER